MNSFMNLLPFILALGFFLFSVALRQARGKWHMTVLPSICVLVFMFDALAEDGKVYGDLLFAFLALGTTIKNPHASNLRRVILFR